MKGHSLKVLLEFSGVGQEEFLTCHECGKELNYIELQGNGICDDCKEEWSWMV